MIIHSDIYKWINKKTPMHLFRNLKSLKVNVMNTDTTQQQIPQEAINTVPERQYIQKNTLNRHSGCNHRWSQQRANEWYEKNGWIVGCNYIPSTAINQLEMWQAETFDPFSIDKELSWAARLGFNTIRVFLHHLVWEQNQQNYLRRIDQFLS